MFKRAGRFPKNSTSQGLLLAQALFSVFLTHFSEETEEFSEIGPAK